MSHPAKAEQIDDEIVKNSHLWMETCIEYAGATWGRSAFVLVSPE